jgi:plastocyanin
MVHPERWEMPMKTASSIAIIAIGLCGNMAVTTPSRAQGRERQVEIVLSDFAFTPQNPHLRRGQAYRLRFTNRASGGHNFSAPAFFASARVNPADAGYVAGGKVELGARQSVSVRLIPAAGIYDVTCTHFLHAGFGMVGRVTVD